MSAPRTSPTVPAQSDVDATVVNVAESAAATKAEPIATASPVTPESIPSKKISRVGDFQLLRKLGQGGMGTVYLAKQVSLDRLVALKTLSKELSKREDFVARFLREARAMAKLDHPNIVRAYAAETSQGLHFAAIEYVDGQSMQKWLEQLGRLSVGDALLVTLATADGLRHAHEQNMIHRDIKPDNILVTARGVIKVADFGLAKATDEDVSMTQSGVGLGTPLYMAPEQARNAKYVDVRSDIYALGCTLYHFVAGVPPFTGKDTLEIILLKEQGRFTSARKHNPEVTERLDLMIDKMLAKDPQHRYANCDELIRDLSSLQLANTSLSFIDDALPALPGSSSSPSTGRKKIPSGGAAKTKATVPAAKSKELPWFVLHTAVNGQATVSRMTTAQVLKGLHAGLFDARTTRLKKTEHDDFLPAAQFVEFEAVANAMASRAATQQRTRSLTADFATFEKQDRWRRRLKPVKSFLSGLGGLFSLLLWLAFIAGVIWAAWYWGWDYIRPQGE